ncbi:MAG: hypothetical protein OHK0021_24190 [Bryobacter sp.]
MRHELRFCFLLGLMAVGAWAESFSFSSILRAGRFAGADWEIGIGPGGTNSASTSSFNYLGAPGNNHWGNANTWHDFQIGWNANTQSAFVRVFNANNVATTVSVNKPGPALLTNAIWTIPASSFFLGAAARPGPTSVAVQNVSLSSGVQVLSGTLPNGAGVSQNGSGSFLPNGAPIVINPASAGGSWTISGEIRFTGLTSQGGVAQNSQLQFLFGATGSDVPEAGTLSTIGLGLVGLAIYRRRMRSAEGA